MFAVTHFWKVRPGREAEHQRVLTALLEAQRRFAPAVCLNLVLGPSAEGEFAEIQVYANQEAYAGLTALMGDNEVARLWAALDPLIEPGSMRSHEFAETLHLADSFARATARIGFVEGRHRLAGKVALVTGAWRGNGRGIALALAKEGADLVIADREVTLVAETQALVEAMGRQCLALTLDVTDAEQIDAAIVATIERFGGLDILVNNAGVFPFKPIQEFTSEEFQRVWEVNVKGPWMLARAAAPLMEARGGGAIVNITSCSGHHGGASPGGSAYDSSKGALQQLTYSLAVELGPKQIRVNAIAPGVIATEAAGGDAMVESVYGKSEIARTPIGRLGYPPDVGAVAAFLASPDASFVNGITVILDGGAMAAW